MDLIATRDHLLAEQVFDRFQFPADTEDVLQADFASLSTCRSHDQVARTEAENVVAEQVVALLFE